MSGRIGLARGQRSCGNISRGRGEQSGCQSNNNQKKSISKKTLQEFQYYLDSSKQASDYRSTTSYLINQFKKTYTYDNDIATAC
jgi:hypothetical protein